MNLIIQRRIILLQNVRIGEPKVSADKEQNPNYSDIADNESHGGKIRRELFCVTEKDLEFIDIDSIFGNDKMVIQSIF